MLNVHYNNWRLLWQRVYIAFWVDFHFLQDQAYIWQMDLFWHEKHCFVINCFNSLIWASCQRGTKQNTILVGSHKLVSHGHIHVTTRMKTKSHNMVVTLQLIGQLRYAAFTAYIYDVGHSRYAQWTPVKTGFLLPSITWK